MNTPSQYKISVIVPVYNVEKYLPKCIESILAQTYTDFELLLIDDGSSDRSGAICDEYAARDPRIRVFHKPNGGVSLARNYGLDNATGKYVTFLDADDWLTSDALQICSNYLTSYDILRFSIKFIYSGDERTQSYFDVDESDTYSNYVYKVISRNTFLGVCGGFYRRSIIESNNIRFSTELISGEDWLVLFEILLYSNSIKFINKRLYCYNRYNEASCTHSFRYQAHYSIIMALRAISQYATNSFGAKNIKGYISEAKCDVVYDFFSSKITRGCKLNHTQINNYKKAANLSVKDIIKGTTALKKVVALLIYKSLLGKLILRF